MKQHIVLAFQYIALCLVLAHTNPVLAPEDLAQTLSLQPGTKAPCLHTAVLSLVFPPLSSSL